MFSRLGALLLVAFCFASQASATDCWHSAPCSGTVHGAHHTGTLDILAIFVDVDLVLKANVKVLLGGLVHTIIVPVIVKGTDNVPRRWGQTCNILNLRLAAIEVDILDIKLSLDEVLVNLSVGDYGELSNVLCDLCNKDPHYQYAVLNSCLSQYNLVNVKLDVCLKLNVGIVGGIVGVVGGLLGH